MTVNIMDGHTNSDHITSDDWAVFNEAVHGYTQGVFTYGDNFALTMTSATAGTIGTGAGLVRGRRFYISEPQTLEFEEVSTNSSRYDVIAVHYDATEGIESVSLKVYSSEEGAAAPPTVPEGDLALYRVYFTNNGSSTTYTQSTLFGTQNRMRDFITNVNASLSFLSKSTASATYLTQTNAANTYRKKADVIPIANGGTGQTTVAAARNALGLGNTTGALPIANGGTGSTTAANARSALGITPANIGAAASSHTHAMSAIVNGSNVMNDFIIAQGSTDGWYYRKWNSGKKECWGIFAMSPGAWATSCGIREAAGSLPNYPFTWTTNPCLQLTPYMTTGGYFMCHEYKTARSLSRAGVLEFYSYTAINEGFSIYAHAIGY